MEKEKELICNELKKINTLINIIFAKVGEDFIWGSIPAGAARQRIQEFSNRLNDFVNLSYDFISDSDLLKIRLDLKEYCLLLIKYNGLLKRMVGSDHPLFENDNVLQNIESKFYKVEGFYREYKRYEFNNYLIKVECLIKIESLLYDLEGRLLDSDIFVFDIKTLEYLTHGVKNLLLEYNNLDKSKFWLIFPLKTLKEIEDDLKLYLNSNELGVKNIDEIIKKINNLISNIPNPSLINQKADTEEFRLSAELFSRLKSLKKVEFELVNTNSKLEFLRDNQQDLLVKFNDSTGEVKQAYEGIKENRLVSSQYLDEIQKEKNVILSYSEDIKNTDSVAVYTKIYDNEIKIAAWFRFFALLIFGIFSFLAIFCLTALFLFEQDQIVVKNLTDISRIYAKIPFILTFFVFGFYLAREGEKHRRIANQAKQTEGELIALASYTNGWDSHEIKELKIKLADKYFGKNINETDKNSSADLELINALVQQTKATTDLAKLIQGVESKVTKTNNLES